MWDEGTKTPRGENRELGLTSCACIALGHGHIATANDTLEEFAEETCFYGRLEKEKDNPPDGAPVAVWAWSRFARRGFHPFSLLGCLVSLRESTSTVWGVSSVFRDDIPKTFMQYSSKIGIGEINSREMRWR